MTLLKSEEFNPNIHDRKSIHLRGYDGMNIRLIIHGFKIIYITFPLLKGYYYK
jgi:hypothetical protein